jgi:hypothetical protein
LIEKAPELAGGVVVVVVVEPEVVGGSSVDVPTVVEEPVLEVEVVVPVVDVVEVFGGVVLVVDVVDVFGGVVVEVATDEVGGAVVVVADVVPAPVVPELVVDVVPTLGALVLAPVAEGVLAVESRPQAVSAVITTQQEIRRTVSILFRTVTPRRTARKFELCEMYSGLKNVGQYVSQRRLSRHETSSNVRKPYFFAI